MNDDTLTHALDQLDLLLQRESLQIEIVICGAYAIKLHGFDRGIFTQDIHSITSLTSPRVIKLIQEVGNSLGLGPKWLNDQASTVPIPEGALARARPLEQWTAIKASLIHRLDLIKMKASAFSIRREETLKDWEDLKLLRPSSEELEAAIEFIRVTNSPPQTASKRIKEEFQETIDDLRKLNS